MKKVIYVEGVTELVFVYNLICTHYDYDGNRVKIQLVNLDPVAGLQIPADFGLSTASDFFQIVCAGGDSSVISRIQERYQGHIDAGFEIIVGLKDVYGEAYVSLAGHRLEDDKVKQIIEIQRKQLINERNALLCFAIMEVEAWILGMRHFLEREFPGMLYDKSVNPEKAFVHPYDIIHEAFAGVGVQFNKHWGDILSVIGKMSKNDFEELYHDANCHSFTVFYDTLFR